MTTGTVLFKLKCVVCGHRWELSLEPAFAEYPHCPLCFGPGVVDHVKTFARKRKPK